MYKLSCYIQELEKEATVRKQNDILLEWPHILNNQDGGGWLVLIPFCAGFPFGRRCPSHDLSPVGRGSPKGTEFFFGQAMVLGAHSAPRDTAQLRRQDCKMQFTSLIAKIVFPAAQLCPCQMDWSHFKPFKSRLVLY